MKIKEYLNLKYVIWKNVKYGKTKKLEEKA